jgi:hypothetical protein
VVIRSLTEVPLNQLNSGNGEIGGWICAAGAPRVETIDTIPGTGRAGTGVGLGFAIWR